MSQENVEIVRQAYEAWGRGDPKPVVEALDSAMEWNWTGYPLPDVPERGRGRENYLRFLADFSASWADHEIDCTFMAVDDHVVVAIHEKMRAAGGDLSLERDIAHVCTVRDGKIVLVRAYRNNEAALEAAGLSE